jgi:hypothetical protein
MACFATKTNPTVRYRSTLEDIGEQRPARTMPTRRDSGAGRRGSWTWSPTRARGVSPDDTRAGSNAHWRIGGCDSSACARAVLAGAGAMRVPCPSSAASLLIEGARLDRRGFVDRVLCAGPTEYWPESASACRCTCRSRSAWSCRSYCRRWRAAYATYSPGCSITGCSHPPGSDG